MDTRFKVERNYGGRVKPQFYMPRKLTPREKRDALNLAYSARVALYQLSAIVLPLCPPSSLEHRRMLQAEDKARELYSLLRLLPRDASEEETFRGVPAPIKELAPEDI